MITESGNPLPEPGAPGAPNCWMYETSGVLKAVIVKYMEDREMSAADIGILRAYLRQWILSPAWDENPHATRETRHRLQALRQEVELIADRKSANKWISKAVDEGMDPL